SRTGDEHPARQGRPHRRREDSRRRRAGGRAVSHHDRSRDRRGAGDGSAARRDDAGGVAAGPVWEIAGPSWAGVAPLGSTTWPFNKRGLGQDGRAMWPFGLVGRGVLNLLHEHGRLPIHEFRRILAAGPARTVSGEGLLGSTRRSALRVDAGGTCLVTQPTFEP